MTDDELFAPLEDLLTEASEGIATSPLTRSAARTAIATLRERLAGPEAVNEVEQLVLQIHQTVKRGRDTADHGLIGNLRCILDHLCEDPEPEAVPQAEPVADHIEQRLRTWRQQQMNRSGDRLALDDFMGADSIADLVDFVCDEYALAAILPQIYTHPAPAVPLAGRLRLECKLCGEVWLHMDAPSGAKASINLGIRSINTIVGRVLQELAPFPT